MQRVPFRFLLKILPLIGLFLVAASCSREKPVLGPDSDDATAKAAAVATGYCNPGFHDRMEGYLAQNEGVQMEAFSTTIEWTAGGVLEATPADWPEGYEIRMIFPPRAVSPRCKGFESVRFTVAVPAAGPGPGVTAVPIEFLPDGIVFDNPPRLIFCWPPWAGTPTQEVLTLAMITEEERDGGIHYRKTDAFASAPAAFATGAVVEPLTGWTEKDLSTGFEFSLPHFCQWEVIDGDESDDGSNDSFRGLPAAGESCWTPLAEQEPALDDPVG